MLWSVELCFGVPEFVCFYGSSVGVEVEPTGALTLGALLEHSIDVDEVVVVISGKNVDSTLYDSIIQKGGLNTL